MEKFNQNKYVAEWKKENMSSIKGTYNNDFVLEFKEACKTLGITQSEVIRNAAIETIEKAKSKTTK